MHFLKRKDKKKRIITRIESSLVTYARLREISFYLEFLATIFIIHSPPVKEINEERCARSYGERSPISY